MEIKKCTLDDLDQLALWTMQATVDMREGSPWGTPEESPELLAGSRETVETYLTRESYDVYEFLVAGEPVGHIVVDKTDQYPGTMVDEFSIRREYRRKGYGTQALHTLMEYLGVTALDLNVFCWNRRAMAFYESFGFKGISLHMNYGT